MSSSNLAIPDQLLPFAGQIIDTDTHESLPHNHWVDRYGSVVQDFADAVMISKIPAAEQREADDTEINAETVWKKKRLDAPGAFDFERRLDVMDLTGIDKQIVFPGSMGLLAIFFYGNAHNKKIFAHIDRSVEDRRKYALDLISAYNDWTTRIARASSRFVPVSILAGGTPEELTQRAKDLVRTGARGVWLPSSVPPGGMSPAHTVFDPLWSYLADANVPVFAHVGADHGFLATEAWRDAPAFEGFRLGDEFSLDPWTLATNHRATENFLTTLILGGVFDRHPNLRYGAMESGGNWIGPLAEHLDLWIEHSGVFVGPTAPKPKISMRPSEYIRRNVRVAPFGFEDVGSYVKMYNMPEVYCYQSDFPHIEGGKDPMGMTVKSFERAGCGFDDMKKFYVDNAKWLVPG
ncbi:MAG: amidohydrolase family protein [Caulobacterales bacterium]